MKKTYLKLTSIEELAKALAMSSTQVYRKIKALTGLSTAIFVRHIRLKNAYRLLRTTDQSVSEIAYDVGFKDPAAFSRYFSQLFGQSPTFFRQKQVPFIANTNQDESTF